MWRRLTHVWQEHGFNILVVGTILFFLFYWFFFTRHKTKGTYSTSYYFDNKYNREYSKKPRQVTQMSRGESICKEYLQHIFELPFTKCRPSWLYNSVTHENLELDLYNPTLNLAVEYNGKQHYEYIPYLHGNSRINFHNQKYRDEKKMELCQKKQVPLIIVPYTIPHDKIKSFLKNEIIRLRIQGVKKW